jgi:hypothetical protein
MWLVGLMNLPLAKTAQGKQGYKKSLVNFNIISQIFAANTIP